jgi:hypothetical protein
MEVIFLTTLFSILFAILFLTFFLSSRRNADSSADEDSLLPFRGDPGGPVRDKPSEDSISQP